MTTTGIVITVCVSATAGVCLLMVTGRTRQYDAPTGIDRSSPPNCVCRSPECRAARRDWAALRREERRQRPWEGRN